MVFLPSPTSGQGVPSALSPISPDTVLVAVTPSAPPVNNVSDNLNKLVKRTNRYWKLFYGSRPKTIKVSLASNVTVINLKELIMVNNNNAKYFCNAFKEFQALLYIPSQQCLQWMDVSGNCARLWLHTESCLMKTDVHFWVTLEMGNIWSKRTYIGNWSIQMCEPDHWFLKVSIVQWLSRSQGEDPFTLATIWSFNWRSISWKTQRD